MQVSGYSHKYLTDFFSFTKLIRCPVAGPLSTISPAMGGFLWICRFVDKIAITTHYKVAYAFNFVLNFSLEP